MTAILIDSREPEWVKALTFGGLPVAVTKLETGDVQAVTDDGHMLIIERKTPDDFLGSLKENRLLIQMERMGNLRYDEQLAGRKASILPYLVITGALSYGSGRRVVTERGLTGWDYAAVTGALLSIQEMGVLVASCAGDSDFEEAVLRLINRKRDGLLDLLPLRPAQMLGPKEALLSCLPHIGIERSQEIMQWANWSLAHALVGLSDPDIPAPVGEKTRKDIRKFLGLKDTQTIELATSEDGKEVLMIASEEMK
jgi:hypothetical protein